MTSQALRDARRYEEEREQQISKEERPEFHLAARVGWMNDPNGFSFYYGKYHLFYQYHPYDSHWGPMHWGHATSEDLLHWDYLPAVMAPDAPYDRDGCYSGSAITLPDGRQMLMYTGLVYIQEDGIRKDLQTQNLAFGDGMDYEKYEGNPVITEEHLPEGSSRNDFRDPKIWQEKDGTYRAIIANDEIGQGGQILLYRSDDALHWEYLSRLVANKGRIGLMWECPDFFELDGKHILLCSAQDMLPDGLEYHNGNGTFYMIGTYDRDNESFLPENDFAVDYGIDFYAPQTILSPDGRRIMIGWMQNWDTCNLRTESIPWYGQMTIPRELWMENGRMYQRPVVEINSLHEDKVEYSDVTVSGKPLSLEGISGRFLDLEVSFRPADEEQIYRKFAIRFAKNESFHTGLSYRPHENSIKIDRKSSGSRRAIIHQRRAEVFPKDDGVIRLRMILDRYSVEIFINDGEKVMSACIYTDIDAKDIEFVAEGGDVKMDVMKYTLRCRS